ncbi:hypothetical protein AVME950_02515 [Acidovorax sp. SUPP950]|uniref:hypothetical protein n=1 Tax=Acidovorax sp. SUPP950 TaxID=511901 RepID=UPI0023D3017C|nr:hypothetical protein [Acidovorax sp. SUPP950]GKS73721.1 hypothetical protein AVME950_02515 [Acidovorax sp. SUPP950]
MRNAQKLIPYESDEAASIKTVTGWVSSNGQFWGKDEHMARYAGSTHRVCEKNSSHGTHEIRGWCRLCRDERMQARYDAMPRMEYDESPVTVLDGDEFFFDADSLRDWLIDNSIAPADARLVFCVPNMASEIDPEDHFADDLPSEDGEVSDRLKTAFAALNEVIRTEPPLSWRKGETAVTLPSDFLN